MIKVHALGFLILLFNLNAIAQYAYRINADILTKTRLVDSTFQVSKGKMYYDINNKKIIFDFTFPRKEKVVLFDTIMYTFNEQGLQSTNANFIIPQQSIFHFMLTGNMSNFGLQESNFVASNVERKKDMVTTTWTAPPELTSMLSKIIIATINKQLYSITMIDGVDQVINRQILKHYQKFDGIEIPTEILVATYLSSGNMYQIISLSNVKLNETVNNQNYNHEL